MEDYLLQYGVLVVYALLAIAVPIGMLLISYLATFIKIRPSKPNEVKLSAYESGLPPFGPKPVMFNFRYYYYAILFVVFDVETVLIFPWAVKYGVLSKQFGLIAMFAMFVFLFIVTVPFIYAWRKGDLEWIYNRN
ncbi:MAG: NADH:ubiquinone oxidoreductase subunit A [Chloroflexi bacterium]|nr:NADH:ubiquinone oxidoreductase subunit A [Chloroflexota bacterium]|tara:strand:+ start:1322 stop:1726 length:405 start_codon:yes stop_codon:yes gene_type:complete